MRRLLLIACSTLFAVLACAPVPAGTTSAPTKVHKILAGGEGGWDYLTVDSEGRRLYVSRGNRVMVIDLDKEAVVGAVTDTPGIRGIAVVPELGKGFTSNGDGSVTVFTLKTLEMTGKINSRGVPDAILYDPASKRVFTFNHRTNNATAIDAAGETVLGTIKFDAEPEAAVADGNGHIFVNLRSSSEIAECDAAALKILNRWPVAPGVRPTGLGIDVKKRRLFSSCANQKMVVMDADKGSVLGTAAIGRGTDACAFDPGTGLAYSSNGSDGTITAVGETEPGKFGVVSTIQTQASARTMALDPKTHRLYLSAATAGPPRADGGGRRRGGRPNFVPGSFVIIVVGD
jgi:DNA-binding beta-propeller fold protein YncE